MDKKPGKQTKLAAIAMMLFAINWIGCVRDRAAMPIGIFDPPVAALPSLAHEGFNLIVAPASPEILDEAARSKIGVLMHGASEMALDPEKQMLLRKLDRHPSAWGWYMSDEPDLHQISPRRMKSESARVKRFVRKPTVVVLSAGGSAEKYAETADRIAVDWYPVPWSSVGTVAREMRLARLGSHEKGFLAILQAFDWNFASNLLETEVPLRAPTPEELRCMTYLALMQGARGIIFYAYTASGWNIETNALLHSAVLRMAAEIRANESMLGERVTWWPVHTKWHGTPRTMYNEIGEARISLALFRSSGPEQRYYLFAANTTAEPADFSFRLPFANVDELPVSCSAGEFQCEDSWIRKMYGPFEVCIFGPIKGMISDE